MSPLFIFTSDISLNLNNVKLMQLHFPGVNPNNAAEKNKIWRDKISSIMTSSVMPKVEEMLDLNLKS